MENTETGTKKKSRLLTESMFQQYAENDKREDAKKEEQPVEEPKEKVRSTKERLDFFLSGAAPKPRRGKGRNAHISIRINLELDQIVNEQVKKTGVTKTEFFNRALVEYKDRIDEVISKDMPLFATGQTANFNTTYELYEPIKEKTNAANMYISDYIQRVLLLYLQEHAID